MKKNRAYKKGEPFRDCSLIIIACEGEKTEPNYFSYFENLHPRKCRVEILRNDEETEKGKGKQKHKSAPKWLLDKIIKYKESIQLGEGDFLFIVSDVDRWGVETLHEICDFCSQEDNMFFIVSNPCFEVWLYYHVGNPKVESARTSQQWKTALHRKTGTGFAFEQYVHNIIDATNQAKSDDKTPDHFLPDKAHTKVYKIIDTIIDKVGEGQFITFIGAFNTL